MLSSILVDGGVGRYNRKRSGGAEEMKEMRKERKKEASGVSVRFAVLLVRRPTLAGSWKCLM